MEIAQGTLLGHYIIGQKLGSGGMADVYQALDERLGRDIAIKVLPPEFARNPDNVARFKREVKAAASLNHKNIITVYDIGEAKVDNFSLYFYTMDLLPGGDLKQRIEKGIPVNETLKIVIETASALAHAHSRGFVHRDIKPENILLDAQGHAVLTDLGIAKAIGSGTRMTKTGMSIGTPHYMSPEQARGKPLDGRSDIYSLGIVLYELLTGKLPFDSGDTFAIALSHVNDPPPPLPDHLQDLQTILIKSLAKDPEKRYPNAIEFADDLRACFEKAKPGEVKTESSITPERTSSSSTNSSSKVQSEEPGGLSPFSLGIVGGSLAIALLLFMFNGERNSSQAPTSTSSSASQSTAQRREQALKSNFQFRVANLPTGLSQNLQIQFENLSTREKTGVAANLGIVSLLDGTYRVNAEITTPLNNTRFVIDQTVSAESRANAPLLLDAQRFTLVNREWLNDTQLASLRAAEQLAKTQASIDSDITQGNFTTSFFSLLPNLQNSAYSALILKHNAAVCERGKEYVRRLATDNALAQLGLLLPAPASEETECRSAITLWINRIKDIRSTESTIRDQIAKRDFVLAYASVASLREQFGQYIDPSALSPWRNYLLGAINGSDDSPGTFEVQLLPIQF
ncbi:MAG: serine/threonine protein kinase [Nitrospira sp.]|nr:serine/threonine protein kinase [Nitrospira sp.]